MFKRFILWALIIGILSVVLVSCGDGFFPEASPTANPTASPQPSTVPTASPTASPQPSPTADTSPPPGVEGAVIADHNIAHESVLRSIPTEYINTARNDFHVLYVHTSHGTHVSYGLFGLPDYKAGDSSLFAITHDATTAVSGKLDLHDFYYESDPPDLSQNGGVDTLEEGVPRFVVWTRDYLDNSANADINVVMWSWCSISGHNIANYLSGMTTLMSEYGVSGSKIGTGTGKTHPVPVHFIFMTGHTEWDNNIGTGLPKNQADLILAHCQSNGFFCLDYFGIDSHDIAGNYYQAANDDGYDPDSETSYYSDWQDSHSLGSHWYYNKNSPGGDIELPQHNTQHITANRKAYAMWWILARMAGWDGLSE